MPHSNKLKKIAAEQNISVTELVQRALKATNGNEFKAAVALGVYPNVIRYWRLGKNAHAAQTSQN